VDFIRFSLDGRWLIVGSIGEAPIMIFDADTGRPAAELAPGAFGTDSARSRVEVVLNPKAPQLAVLRGKSNSLWSILGDGDDLISFARQRAACVQPSDLECREFGLNCPAPRLPEGCNAHGRRPPSP